MKNDSTKYIFAVGRRKTSTATVRLYDGQGENTINGKKLEEVYKSALAMKELMLPLEVTSTKGNYYFTIKTKGGGMNGQIGAIKLALSRALSKKDLALRPELKKRGLLTRDDRMVERKKPGLRKARKAPQYSKR